MASYLDRVIITESGCHLWTGGVDSRGYGQLKVNGKNRLVHRHAWEQHFNVVLERSQIVHHRCHQPLCVNVEHLQLMTRAEHNQEHADDSAIGVQRKKTTCPKGHSYSPENTRVYRGQRNCRACDRKRQLEKYWRKTGG